MNWVFYVFGFFSYEVCFEIVLARIMLAQHAVIPLLVHRDLSRYVQDRTLRAVDGRPAQYLD